MGISADNDTLQGTRLEFVISGAMNPSDAEHWNKVSKVWFFAIKHFERSGRVIVALMESWKDIRHFCCSFNCEPPVLRRESR